MSDRPIKRFPWTIYIVALAVIAFLALGPLISVYLAYLVGDAHGCTVNEAAIDPCIVMGMDVGAALAYMAIFGWLMLATIPFGAGALAIWLIVLLLNYAIYRARLSAADPRN